jgi:Mg-chelatase subunit ChlD
MADEEKKEIQIRNGASEVAIINGQIKIAASEKPVASKFVVDSGQIYMLIDCSGSMKGVKTDQARSGTIDFVRDALKKGYQIGLITFGDDARLLSGPVADIQVMQIALKNIRAGGSTNLTAALKLAHAKLKNFAGTKVIVVVTDGMPDSVKRSLEEAELIKRDQIDIITVGTDDADREFLKKLASRSELSTKVTNDRFSQAISDASFLLSSPKSIQKS